MAGQPLRLLSLDGGGVRGLSTIIILRHLMTQISRKRRRKVQPWEEFDMIGGTSTGGLLAVMLGRLRMTLDECQDAYLRLSERIFNPRRHNLNYAGQAKDFLFANGRFDSQELEAAIKEILVDRCKVPVDELLQEIDGKCHVFVCAVRTGNAACAILRSYENNEPELLYDECKIWEACRATSAATTFFDPIKIGPFDQEFADGAVVYNNPIQLVYREAEATWPDRMSDATIVSIGTGSAPGMAFEGNIKDIVLAMKDIVTQTERTADNFFRDHRQMVDQGYLYRFNVYHGLAEVGLEEYKEKAKIANATQTYLMLGEIGTKIRACTEQLTSSHQVTIPGGVYEIPNLLSPHFSGRKSELEQIKHALNKVYDDIPARCVVYGMPGLGKTQLAVKCSLLAKEDNRYTYIFWISAATVEKLYRDFAKMADLLRFPGRDILDQTSKSISVRTWLEDTPETRKWLLILDNATQETVPTLRDILPKKNRYGNILFTTRTPQVADLLITVFDKAYEKIALQPPNTDDAIAILLSGAEINEGRLEQSTLAAIKSLIRSVGSLPLAIDQAASFMKESGDSAEDILGIYKTEEVDDLLSWENDLSQYEEQSVAATFAPAFKKLENISPDAINLLRIFSFLDPESISLNILKQGSEALLAQSSAEDEFGHTGVKLDEIAALLNSSVRIQKAIQHIQRLALGVQQSVIQERVLWIHDLVQLLLRKKLMTNVEREQWLRVTILIICRAFENIGDRRAPRNWSKCGKYVTHIQAMEKHATQCGITSAMLMDASSWIAIYFNECGLYQEAANINARIGERRKMVLGLEHPDTLTSMANLAGTFWNQGRWTDAEELQMTVMEMSKRVLGLKHPDTLTSMANLAVTFSNQGRWADAEELQINVMEMKKRVLGLEHPSTLISMTNLAVTFMNQGRWTDAEELQIKVMEMSKRVLGLEHPSTLTSMINLAVTFQDQGRLTDAEELQMKVMEMSKRVLRLEHPSTLASMANLAHIYHAQGRDECIQLMSQVVKQRTEKIGANHPDTIYERNTLQSWLNSNSMEDIERWRNTGDGDGRTLPSCN